MFQITHIVPRHVKCSGNAAVSDVLLGVGLAIEVRHILQESVTGFGNVQEGGEDEMLNSNLLGYVGDVLALVEVGGAVRMLPEVGDQEDCMRALKG